MTAFTLRLFEDARERWVPWVKSGLSRLLDGILPPRCLNCGTDVDRTGVLCPRCWTSANFIGEPCCVCCGRPFPYQSIPDALCGACIARPPTFARCRSALAYDDGCRSMILAFKHGDRTDAAVGFATWMGRAGASLVADADFIIPVPLHRWRLFRRRYNQSALLAQRIAKNHGKLALVDLLVRRRATRSQGGLSRQGRRRNVAAAFTLRPHHRAAVQGARILLIDDVLTTGATVEECAKVLLRAGASAVDVLTLARVVRPETPV